MAVDEAARHELYARLEELLGQQPTSTLMSLLPPVGWADVATKDDLRMLGLEIRAEISDLRTELRDEITELRTELRDEITELRDEMRGAIAGVRNELRDEITDVRTEIAGFRTDVADGQRRLVLTLVGAMVSISGITFAANAAL